MKIKTAELIGNALDYAVITVLFPRAFEDKPSILDIVKRYPYSTNWGQGGPIIEREEILFVGTKGRYNAWLSNRTKFEVDYNSPTHLIAAMRCWVTFKLGDEVDIPAELVQSNPI